MIYSEIMQSPVLSEEKLEKAKVVEDKSQFFHSEYKGCDVYDVVIYNRTSGGLLKALRCKHCNTHNVDLCKCGWEFGFHYDTPSLLSSNK